jgi:hypothetical protein
MSYTYPIDAQAMFDDRTHQFVGYGLPAADVARVRAATTHFWITNPEGGCTSSPSWPPSTRRRTSRCSLSRTFALRRWAGFAVDTHPGGPQVPRTLMVLLPRFAT